MSGGNEQFLSKLKNEPEYAASYRAWSKEKIQCTCGAIVARCGMKRHENTRRHQGLPPRVQQSDEERDAAIADRRARRSRPMTERETVFLQLTWRDAPAPKDQDGNWTQEWASWRERRIRCYCGTEVQQGGLRDHLRSQKHERVDAADPSAYAAAVAHGTEYYSRWEGGVPPECPFIVSETPAS